jgi:uncharacterized protein (TIGR00375 family)
MKFIADFHIHSRYSRATSKNCCPEQLEFWARQKGVDLLGTGDFTHATWREELREKLTMSDNGFYVLKERFREKSGIGGREVSFIISGEISSIYKKNGRTRKVHNLIILPDLESARRLSQRLEAIGNLHSDGRPILGLDSKHLLDMTLNVCPTALFIPAHIWTPHFSVLGANSGFDSVEECFEELTGHIYALETGLSSDPPMNWRLSALDRFALVSNSDAHSPGNVAREANIFTTTLSYEALYTALSTNDRDAFTGTIEFFPEEGKYHFDGHRACKVQWEPSRTIAASGICPHCKGKLTVGVLHRVEQLADRDERFVPPGARGYQRMVPLAQVIGACIGSPANSSKVSARYSHMTDLLGPELVVLREASIADITACAGELMAEGIRRVRAGDLRISPGYDGEYGTIAIFTEQEKSAYKGQADLFGSGAVPRVARKKTERRAGGREKKKEGPPAPPEASCAEDFPYGLNLCQWEAASNIGKTIMVIAGPGTGKTRTLVGRAAYLVNERGVAPSSITAVTFTNKAAREMKQRLAVLFKGPGAPRMPFIGTFHALCLDMLRELAPQGPATIIDRASAFALVKDILPAGHAVKASAVAREISLLKAGGPGAMAAAAPEVMSIFNDYQKRLARFNAMDFDDILLEALQTLQRDEASAQRVRRRFGHILVDEFQDINEVQYLLIRQWAAVNGELFVIGDPNQAIYGFRGASPRYFDALVKDFPDARVITLDRNYRCPASVAGAALSVIAPSGRPASLSVTGDNTPVRMVEARDEFFEALFIAKEINCMVGGVDMLDAHAMSGATAAKAPGSRGFSDIAVLYRTHRQAVLVEQCLVKEGIAYRVAGLDDFFDDDSVRWTLSFFRFLLNPRDLLSLVQCCKRYCTHGIDAFVNSYAAGPAGPEGLSAAAGNASVAIDQEGIGSFIARYKRFTQELQKASPRALIGRWMEENAVDREGPGQRLLSVAEGFPTMKSFLGEITLGRDADLVRNGAKTTTSDAVLLTTLHAAKGLEFPVVFLCGVNDGLIPLTGTSDAKVDIEEERRLFYVGLTRAKEELICTLTQRRTVMGAITDAQPSRFIRDMGEKHLKREKYRPGPEVKQMKLL